MTPLEYLREQYASVERTLKETLRHDYGPNESREYFEECQARLALIDREILADSPATPATIAAKTGELTRVGIRVALIERSHLGEFFWPFTDIIRSFAERLFEEEELFAGKPLVHVVSEGTGYQIVDDPATRLGTRRILVIAFPRQLKHHVLVHAIFGHELGHPAARTDDPGRIAQAVLERMEAGPLANDAAARAWVDDPKAPAVVQRERRRGGTVHYNLDDWRTELFCDLFGLFLFGPAFAAAHRAELESSSGWPDRIALGGTHPPYPIRRRLMAQALRVLEWDRPAIDSDGGAAHLAERALLDYVLEDANCEWFEVYPDHILKGVIDELKSVFARHGDIIYGPPDGDELERLISRLALGRPPIFEDLDALGAATQRPVRIQHCLYAGWCAWIGRAPLRQALLPDHPRVRELSFFYVNRLCAQALLQQQAIDAVLKWRDDHPAGGKAELHRDAEQESGPAASGALGRSQIIRRIRDESLIVSPLLSADQIGASSIDLRMGNTVLIVRARGSSHVDPRKAMWQAQLAGHEKEASLQQKHERYELKFKTPFLLHPGTLALVPTLEWVSLPQDLMGSVTARSTWAREGLSIATATMIEPGYQGIVTLELANLGEIPIALYPGLELAQISFFDVVGSTRKPRAGQFELSFEPSQGTIAKDSEYPFLPPNDDDRYR
ncbi:MAG TPA: dCTP deaminase [Allosphingosinicella sp.]